MGSSIVKVRLECRLFRVVRNTTAAAQGIPSTQEVGETQDVHSRSTRRQKTYTQEVGGDTKRTLKKYEETQDVRPRSKGICKMYTQGVRRNTRRTLG